MGFDCYDVKKFDTTNGTTNKWSFKGRNYGLWYMRDSRNISGLVGIFFFFMMMMIFFWSMQTQNDVEIADKGKGMLLTPTRNFRMLRSGRGFCSYEEQIIKCGSVNSSIMEQVQKEINDKFSRVKDYSLSFVNIQDAAKVIQPGWLNKVNVSINSLTIGTTALNEIKADSFYGSPFQNLNKLYLLSTGDLRFNEKSFTGLEKLESLSIQGPDCNLVTAEEETFNAFVSLSSLQIQNCVSNPELLRNLTGGRTNSHLRNLQILDIQGNSLEKLLADSFSKLTDLESLFLTRSNLNEGLEPFVFRGINPKQIYMETAQLTKLPKGIFDDMVGVTLFLSDNRWNCTCDFQWFQEFYNSHSNMFSGNALHCYQNNEDLSTFSFCNSTGTSTATAPSSQTTPTQEPHTTALTTTNEASTTNPLPSSSLNPITMNPDDYDPIKCLEANRSSPLTLASATNIPTVLFLGKEYLRFTFTQIGDEPRYIVTTDVTLGNRLVLILFDQAGWIFCLSELQNNFNVENLNYGQSYTICMMEASEYKVSPRNCQSLTVPKEWGKQSWITNEHKLTIIIGASAGLSCFLLISLCLMYIYVKKNPDLVYGKENVIVVERENSKVVDDQEQKYYQPNKYPPSLISWSDGYLTPKVYESVEEFSLPCIDQYPSDYLERPRIFPSVRTGRSEELEKGHYQASEIYESVNICPSPYYMNDNFAHNTYSSL